MTGPVAAADVSRRGRRWRAGLAVLVLALLVAGTVWGDDDDFPFGPLRMYASTQPLDAATTWFELRGGAGEGDVAVLPYEAFGLRRAELEGRVAQLVADPGLLAELAATYARRNPGAAPLAELQVVEHRQQLAGGRPQGEPTVRVVVAWRQP